MGENCFEIYIPFSTDCTVCIAYDKFGIPNKLTLSIDIDLPSFIRDVEELPSFIASFIF